MKGFEHLEHTADVGIRAWGRTIEECFEQATRGMLDILGAWRPGDGQQVSIAVGARDLGGLLVDWLSEVLYVHDARDAVITKVTVARVTDTEASGSVEAMPRGSAALEGTAVKAVTYHQLEVDRTPEGWTARVFLDV